MEPGRLQSQISLVEEMKKMAESLQEMEDLSQSLALKTKRAEKINGCSTDNLISSLKTKVDEMNRQNPPSGDGSFSQPPSDRDISEMVIKEVERQLQVEIDLANDYRELEVKSRKLKSLVTSTLPRFSLDGDFGQLPMIQAVKNYHDAVAAASRSFEGVPKLTSKLLGDLREAGSSPDGISDWSVLKNKLKQQYEILERARSCAGHSRGSSKFPSGDPSDPQEEDLQSAGWQRYGKYK